MYSPMISFVGTNMNQRVCFIYATFWDRLWASLIDSLVLSVLILAVILFIFNVLDVDVAINSRYVDIANLSLSLCITILFWTFKSATPGKMLLKLKVVDELTLNKLTLKQSIIRYLSCYISLLGFFIGFFWIFFNKKNQGWHDKIAKTIVIKLPSSTQ
ncbi:TPA: RDD family protein [Vibrio cholerae]|nr:RDD family protein [Vibrio cholerae]HDV5602340.1 RDD family protein [Vibrio cholerae]HDV5639392.1 RDD family protein [Vibrio cholerae]